MQSVIQIVADFTAIFILDLLVIYLIMTYAAHTFGIVAVLRNQLQTV